MKKHLLPKILIAWIVMVVGVSSSLTANAQSPASTSKSTCNVVHITLHQHAVPTTTCQTVSIKASTMSIRGFACGTDTNDLVLYWNGPIGVSPNYLLCIAGLGTLSLNSTFGTGRNWNHQASAWWTGCGYVDFRDDHGNIAYADGSYQGLNSPSGIFPYGPGPIGTIGNDDLSSVQVGDMIVNNCPASWH